MSLTRFNLRVFNIRRLSSIRIFIPNTFKKYFLLRLSRMSHSDLSTFSVDEHWRWRKPLPGSVFRVYCHGLRQFRNVSVQLKTWTCPDLKRLHFTVLYRRRTASRTVVRITSDNGRRGGSPPVVLDSDVADQCFDGRLSFWCRAH